MDTDPIVHLTSTDVICGRSKLAELHPGNAFFEKLVSNYSAMYNHASCSKLEKTNIIQKIIREMKNGRFLKKRKQMWYIIDIRSVHEKISNSLRCASPSASLVKDSADTKVPKKMRVARRFTWAGPGRVFSSLEQGTNSDTPATSPKSLRPALPRRFSHSAVSMTWQHGKRESETRCQDEARYQKEARYENGDGYFRRGISSRNETQYYDQSASNHSGTYAESYQQNIRDEMYSTSLPINNGQTHNTWDSCPPHVATGNPPLTQNNNELNHYYPRYVESMADPLNSGVHGYVPTYEISGNRSHADLSQVDSSWSRSQQTDKYVTAYSDGPPFIEYRPLSPSSTVASTVHTCYSNASSMHASHAEHSLYNDHMRTQNYYSKQPQNYVIESISVSDPYLCQSSNVSQLHEEYDKGIDLLVNMVESSDIHATGEFLM